MPVETADLARTVRRRIFFIQTGLVVTIALLLLVSDELNISRYYFDYWLAFFAGCMGASIALMRRIGADSTVLQDINQDNIDTMIPILYGAILSGLTYFLFMSGILSGATGDGLLTSNLFPTFKFDAKLSETEGAVRAFLRSRPSTVPDLGKLLVWCFLAGYSEKFVIGILRQLERRTEQDDAAGATKSK